MSFKEFALLTTLAAVSAPLVVWAVATAIVAVLGHPIPFAS
jgi:hypothetical protein